MKSFVLTAMLVVSSAALTSTATAEVVQLKTRDSTAFKDAVARAVEAWRATNPDTSFLSVGNAIEYGIGWLESLKPTEASWRFEEAVKADPENVYAHYFLGLSYYGMGRWADAQKALSTVVTLAPDWSDVTSPWVRASQSAARAEAEAARPKPAPAPKPTPASSAITNTPRTAPTAPPAVTPAPAKATPKAVPRSVPVGNYTCRAQIRTLTGYSNSGGVNVPQYQYRSEARGILTIVSASQYRIGNGTAGFTYDPTTGRITWKGGALGAAKPGDSEYGLDGERNRVISVWIGGEQRFCVGGKG